jgi:predicted ATP-dependent Lon-type protease
MAALSILNVADALVSVTCVAKFTAALDEPLWTCICLTRQRPLVGAVNTLVVPVVVNEKP